MSARQIESMDRWRYDAFGVILMLLASTASLLILLRATEAREELEKEQEKTNTIQRLFRDAGQYVVAMRDWDLPTLLKLTPARMLEIEGGRERVTEALQRQQQLYRESYERDSTRLGMIT
jgi:hypothetical protein